MADHDDGCGMDSAILPLALVVGSLLGLAGSLGYMLGPPLWELARRGW